MSPHAPRWTRFCTRPWGVSAAGWDGTVETAPTMSREEEAALWYSMCLESTRPNAGHS